MRPVSLVPSGERVLRVQSVVGAHWLLVGHALLVPGFVQPVVLATLGGRLSRLTTMRGWLFESTFARRISHPAVFVGTFTRKYLIVAGFWSVMLMAPPSKSNGAVSLATMRST